MAASRMRGDLFECPSGLTPFVSAIAIFAVLAFPATALAQTGSIDGVVTTMGGGDALSGVSVRVTGAGRGVLSDGAGRYLLDGLAAGTVTLRVELLGYAAFSAEVVVTAGQVTTRDVSLSVDPLGISGIVVSGSRRAEKLTEAPITISIIDAAQLEVISPILPTGSLERLPGVSVNRSGVVNWHFNARGFTSAFNYRFQVMADNRKVHMPGTGTAINSGTIPR